MGNNKTARIALALAISSILIAGMLSETTQAQDGTPTATPTATSIFLCGGAACETLPTPIAATPTPPDFESDPDYQSPPTPIPALVLPTIPSFTIPEYVAPNPPTAIPTIVLPSVPSFTMPSPLSGTVITSPTAIPTAVLPTVTTSTAEISLDLPEISLATPELGLASMEYPDLTLPTPGATLAAIDSSLSLSVTAPISLSATNGGSNVISAAGQSIVGTLVSGRGVVSDVISNTNALSATWTTLWNQNDAMAAASAPDWYAPTLPRPIADIGWRFELMGEDVRRRYSLTAWGGLVADIIALPIRFIKGLQDLGALLGPFGLFLTWMWIMLPVVLFFKIIEFIKNLAINTWNFVVQVAHIIMDLIELIPGE